MELKISISVSRETRKNYEAKYFEKKILNRNVVLCEYTNSSISGAEKGKRVF